MMSRDNFIDRLRAAAAVLCAACVLTGCGVRDSAYVFDLAEGTTHAPEEVVGTGMYGETVGAQAQRKDGEAASETGTKEPALIYVHVCGAVMCPGVVALPEGSRAEDALQAAGGFAEDARTDYVNLAARISDGERLYFPDCNMAEGLTAQESSFADGLVNINTADAARLCTLPGIGEARAQAIIDYREENGCFQSVEDIMKVSGIKSAAYEKLRDRITIN